MLKGFKYWSKPDNRPVEWSISAVKFHLTDKQSKVWWLMKSDSDQAIGEERCGQLNFAGRVSATAQVFFSHRPTVFQAGGKTNWRDHLACLHFPCAPASRSYTNINCTQTHVRFSPRLSANVGSAGSAAVPAFNTVCSCQQDCLDTVFAVCPLFVWFHRVHFSLHALISRRLNNSLTGTGYTKAPWLDGTRRQIIRGCIVSKTIEYFEALN